MDEFVDGDAPVQHSRPDLTCFGCGPAHEDGIGIESYREGETLVATVDPGERFGSGMENVAYGGYLASLVDCHSVWTAITFAHLAEEKPLGSDPPLHYVTGELNVTYEAPTPMDRPIHMTARPESEVGRSATVRTAVASGDDTTVTAEVTAVRVDPDEVPGRHRE
ncbi:thioesterase [Halobacteriales archaeon QS_8_69_26]|nr:MAG: thioesterase [Halobacteriales archaeon QS_8_69_26]